MYIYVDAESCEQIADEVKIKPVLYSTYRYVKEPTNQRCWHIFFDSRYRLRYDDFLTMILDAYMMYVQFSTLN